jgi:DNA-binding NarL/FixJ family response regulator
MVQVLVVDDQPIFRRVAREVIDATPGFALLGEAESGEQGLAVASELKPDLVLLDVRLPGGIDGVETATRIRACPDPPVVILISVEDPGDVPSARTSGAATFVRKQDFGPALLRRLWWAYGERDS